MITVGLGKQDVAQDCRTRRFQRGDAEFTGKLNETYGVINVGIGMQDSAQDLMHTQIPMRRHRIRWKT